MATTLTSQINIDARGQSTKNGRSTVSYITTSRVLANGTLVDQADKCYYGITTIPYSSSPGALDFSGGGLIDSNGDTITWVEMVGLIVSSPSTNTVNIVIGNHAAPLDFGCGASGTITIKPGETKVLINIGTDPGYPITAVTADTLKLYIASGTNQDVEILALGRSV